MIQNFNRTDNRNDAGVLFENFILNELLNAVGKENIYYFKSKIGTEIDFIIKKGEIIPVEVKYKKLKNASGLRALKYFINKNSIKKGYLVNLTLNQISDDKKIEIVDFLKFLNRIRGV